MYYNSVLLSDLVAEDYRDRLREAEASRRSAVARRHQTNNDELPSRLQRGLLSFRRIFGLRKAAWRTG